MEDNKEVKPTTNKPVLKNSNAGMNMEELENKSKVWNRIIKQSLEYFTSKYPKLHETFFDYSLIDKACEAINLEETNILKQLHDEYLAKYEEDPFDNNSNRDSVKNQETIIRYLASNQAFMDKCLFVESDSDVIINEFNKLQNILIGGQTGKKVSELIQSRKKMLDKLVVVDGAELNPGAKAKFYRRMFLLRKQNCIREFTELLRVKQEDGFNISTTNFVRLANIINYGHDFATFKIERIRKESEHKKPMLKASPTKDELSNIKKQIKDVNADIEEDMKRYASLTEAEKDEAIKYIKASKDKREVLTELYASSKKAWEQEHWFQTYATGVKDDFKKDIGKNIVKLVAANATKSMAQYLLNPSKEGFENMANETGKAIITALGVQVATAFLGPIGGALTSQVLGMVLAGQTPDDPNKKRFDQIDKKLDTMVAKMNEMNTKLDSLANDINEVIAILGEIPKLTDIHNKIQVTLTEINTNNRLINSNIKRVTNLYTELIKPNVRVDVDIAEIKSLDSNLRKSIDSILQLVWNSSADINSISDWSIPDKPGKDSLVQLLVDCPVSDYRKFDSVLDRLLPIFNQLSDIIYLYASHRQFVFSIMCIYYVDVDYAQKGVSNVQDNLFETIATEEKLHKKDDVTLKEFLLELVIKFGNPANFFGSNAIDLYNNYSTYSVAIEHFGFKSTFCIEQFDEKEPDNFEKSYPLVYDYQEGRFKKQISKKYDRFLLLPKANHIKDRKTHALHCLNDELCQEIIPINITFDKDDLSCISLPEYYIPEKGTKLRLVSIASSRTSQNYNAAYKNQAGIINKGQLDSFILNEMPVDINIGETIEFGLSVSYLKLRVKNYSSSSSSKQLFRLSLYDIRTGEQSIIVEEQSFFKPNTGNQFFPSFLEGLIKPDMKTLENEASKTLGVFDITVAGSKYLDNRYLFTTVKDANRNLTTVYRGQKIPEVGLVNNKKHTVLFDKELGLALKSGPLNTHWYAGIERNSFDKINGLVAWVQWDGNLVIYDKNGKKTWSTSLKDLKDAYLILQEDRNLVLYESDDKAVWASDSFPCKEKYEIRVGDSISVIETKKIHKKLISECSCRAEFKFQGDGNLVLYAEGNAKEASHTDRLNPPAKHAVFEPKGKISIYDGNYNLIKTVIGPEKYIGKGAILRIEVEYDGTNIIKGEKFKGYMNIIDGVNKGNSKKFWEWNHYIGH